MYLASLAASNAGNAAGPSAQDLNALRALLENRLQQIEAAIAPPVQENTEDPKFFLYTDVHNNLPFNANELKEVFQLEKAIPVFSGNPGELSQFLNITENFVYRYTPRSANDRIKSNQLHTLCTIIRNKIQGEANRALVNNFVSLNFNCIKRTLITYFGEKRDLTTLGHQLMNCCQSNRTLEEFYDDINRFMSHIANIIRTNTNYSNPAAAKAMIDHYNEQALDSFIRGLDGDTGKFVKCYKPLSLASAYAYCVEIQNMDYRRVNVRKTHENHNNPRNAIPLKPLPRIPVKPQPKINQSFFSPQSYTPRFYPSFQNFQQIPPMIPPRYPDYQSFYNKPQFQTQYQPQFQRPPFQQQQQMNQFNNRPFPPKPTFQPNPTQPKFVLNQQQRPQFNRNPFQPKPEPMEIDPSIRTNQVNYQNRPNNPDGPNKRPRMFNIEQQLEEALEEENQEPTAEDYLAEYELVNPENDTEEDLGEFNFLG